MDAMQKDHVKEAVENSLLADVHATMTVRTVETVVRIRKRFVLDFHAMGTVVILLLMGLISAIAMINASVLKTAALTRRITVRTV